MCITLIIIGLFIIDKPIADYQLLANTYLQTSFELPIYAKQEFNFLKIYRFIALLVLAPICEELLFRQHILRGLQQENGQKIAIFVSSLLFGLIHFDNVPHIINTFIFGIVVAIFILKNKNFYHAILLHFTLNLFYVLQTIFLNQ